MSGTGAAGYEGTQPEVKVREGNPEALKYGRMWERPEYRAVAPGEDLAAEFVKIARPAPGSDVIDFGCGTGRGALALALPPPVGGNLRVTMVDFVRNCLDEDVRNALETQSHVLRFVKHDLEQRLPFAAEYGYCTDVMEHIPEDRVDRVLANVLMAAQHVFFAISTTDDSCGKLIGEKLHLTVRPYAWWLEQFRKYECVVHYSRELPGSAIFYVTAWPKGEDVVDVGVVNTLEAQVLENVKANIAGPYGERLFHPFATNDLEMMILGGGPSTRLYLDEIRGMRERGVKLVTLNGAYNWAIAHDLSPISAQIVCDAREFNARFTRPVLPLTQYLICSQVHPSVLEGLPVDRTLLWHTTADFTYEVLKERYPLCFPVPGGSTVLLRSIPLLRTLGYRKFHLFGCDSCVVTTGGDGTLHHAYQQPENDKDAVIPVVMNPGGRVFGCTTWMLSQAQEFMDLIKFMGNTVELEVYGDGLLAHILKTAAELPDEEITLELA